MPPSTPEDWARRLAALEDAIARRSRGELSRDCIKARHIGQMKRVAADAYASAWPPAPGSVRDRRLRALVSRRRLAELSNLSLGTVVRAEHGSESGDRDAVSTASWRALARGLSRASGKPVRVSFIRPPRVR